MSSRLRDILAGFGYATAVSAGHLALLALVEVRSADSILRVYAADDQTVRLFGELLRQMELSEQTAVLRLSSTARARNVAEIEAVLSEMARREVSYDEAEAGELLRQLRKVPV